MQEALNNYSAFYQDKHTNRVLTWAHYLGSATLIARCPKGKKELSVSLYQALVLLLFSERDSWTVEDIQAQTMLSKYEAALRLIINESLDRYCGSNDDDPVACVGS